MKSIDLICPIYYCDPSLFLTIETCLSTLRVCYPQINQILVDDCSPLDLPSHWDIAEENVVNMGYTATVNRGLMLSEADIVIVANDDLSFFPGCLDRYYDLPDMVIASPADTASGDMEGFGSIFGMTRETFKVMGLLDERYKHFFSDNEYQERARSLGIEVIKWKDIILEHPESSTFKLLDKEKLLKEDQAAA